MNRSPDIVFFFFFFFLCSTRHRHRIAALDDEDLRPARQDCAGRQSHQAGAEHHYVLARPFNGNPESLARGGGGRGGGGGGAGGGGRYRPFFGPLWHCHVKWRLHG